MSLTGLKGMIADGPGVDIAAYFTFSSEHARERQRQLLAHFLIASHSVGKVSRLS